MQCRYKSTVLTHTRRTRKEEASYKCDKCEQSFAQSTALKRHTRLQCCTWPIQTAHRKKLSRMNPTECTQIRYKRHRRFGCKYCGKKYRIKSNREKHIRLAHASEARIKLDVCENDLLPPNDKVERHLAESNLPAETTAHCENILKASVEVCRHLKCDKYRPRLSHDACQKASPQYDNVKRYFDVMHPSIKGSYPCDLCSSIFSSDYLLKTHVTSRHYGELFKCAKCRKRFTRSEGLKKHLEITHTNTVSVATNIALRSFKCELCERSFLRMSQVKMHMDIVHSEKRFKCTECGKLFGYKSCLNRHMKLYHAGYYDDQT